MFLTIWDDTHREVQSLYHFSWLLSHAHHCDNRKVGKKLHSFLGERWVNWFSLARNSSKPRRADCKTAQSWGGKGEILNHPLISWKAFQRLGNLFSLDLPTRLPIIWQASISWLLFGSHLLFPMSLRFTLLHLVHYFWMHAFLNLIAYNF